MTITLAQYYDRFNPAQNYERHLFRAGSVLQSAELNELQSTALDRLKRLGDVLFQDGAVLSGAECVVDADTGVCQCAAGAIYLRGAARGVPPRTFTIATSGLVAVGVYLVDSVITELDDPTLRDPAIDVRNFQEPGAARLQAEAHWGYADEPDQTGEFYTVYQVEDGIVLGKGPPPQVDAVALAIARYDRQSAGGYYISTGMTVSRLADTEAGAQVYSVTDGIARVNGVEIVRQHARRLEHPATPDTRTVTLEPHLAQGGTERVNTHFAPITTISAIAITKETTASLTHGPFSGAQDLLPHSPVIQILEVTQGATTYAPTDDYLLTANKVDWSPTGAEPAPGSTYSVTYQYIATVAPIDLDDTGFTVQDAVADTLIQVTYNWALPRFDLICLNVAGDLVTVQGVSAPVSPRIPAVPADLLQLAMIEQRWTVATRVVNNAVRMVPMSELNAVNERIDNLFALVAQDRLALNLTQRDNTAYKGVFTDPFLDDDMRDQGLAQTAAIFRGELTLGVEAVVHFVRLATPTTLTATTPTLLINQSLRTGNMKVNPYDAFAPLPAVARLTPAVDFWTDLQTNWLSPITRQFDETVWTNPGTMNQWIAIWNATHNQGSGAIASHYTLAQWIAIHTRVVSTTQVTQAETELVGARYVDAQYLRQISIRFDLSGFGPGEILQTVIFDGKSVAFGAL